MSERDIAITVIVLLSVLSILTTPFMLVKRGNTRRESAPRTLLQRAIIVSSNAALIVLLIWLAWYWLS